jgi:ribosome-binding protein aMBF1 (putative translation factor)
MITADQIKAARKLLGWSTATLAIRSKRTVKGVALAESSNLPPERMESSLRLIQQTFEAAGIEFVDGEKPGVRLRNGP